MPNLEDQPPLNTSIIGVRPDGTVWAYQPNAPDGSGMVELSAATTPPPPVLTLGAGSAITSGEIFLTPGWNLFLDTATHTPLLFDADGTTTTAPDDGEVYPISVT
jgi:hypothetical protein